MSQKPHKPGDFLRLPLPDGSFGYGRCREFPVASFYGLRTPDPVVDLDRIASAPLLFTVAVHKNVHREWEHIGNRPLDGALLEPFVRVRQPVGSSTCTVVSEDGSHWEAAVEDCIGMERMAVWDAHHVASRIVDEMEGRENAFAKLTRVSLSRRGSS